jgi:hypothetical protein
MCGCPIAIGSSADTLTNIDSSFSSPPLWAPRCSAFPPVHTRKNWSRFCTRPLESLLCSGIGISGLAHCPMRGCHQTVDEREVALPDIEVFNAVGPASQ